jgi:hypothetical protein
MINLEEINMVRFELLINGKKICVSGIEEYGVLDAILHWVKRNPKSYNPEKHSTFEEWIEEELEIRMGGLDSTNPRISKHIEWDKRSLKVGDELTLRILPPGEIDLPRSVSSE